MRSLLLTVAVIALPLAWLGVIWLVIRDRAPATLSAVTVGERLNVTLSILAVVSTAVAVIAVGIALATYRQTAAIARWQLEAGNQQSQTLRAETDVLVTARDTLAKMLEVSEKSREALETQIELTRREKAAEEARLMHRPRVEIDFGSTSWATLRLAVEHKSRIAISRDEFRSAQARFTIRNVGDATLLRPVVVVSASDPSINVNPRQFSGPGVEDVVPFSMIGKGYTYETRITVPPTVASFELTLQIFGDNMPARQFTLPIVLVEG